ncbi:YbfB/YjiJ family MFS transporter [Brevibacillus nitrificans]|uniref:YbfB/YjiJ family MFS transporter n=1 Tax=Brevibacillus nitrificans TaxID=651560 RepID=UPI002629C091|nr:YbfB/YjiJ family MFS transporter [Brevibacillus nitrificans]MED1792093.1 YbfB/YjiJ family MFS transporter [Brevibacillus nitrificans]
MTNSDPMILNAKKAIISGFVMLMIAMGIGRFSYTSILPLMESQAHLSVSNAGYLAASNNLGYLIAAFGAGFITWGSRKAYHLRIQLALCIVSTGLMGVTTSFSIWMALRFLSGISSGLIFVLSSSFILDVLISAKCEKWAGIFYGGVGAGIALTGVVVPILNNFTWRGTWIGLLIISVILILPVWSLIRDDNNLASFQDPKPNNPSMEKKTHLFRWLLVTYGLEGLGYIVSATFLVAMVKQMPNASYFADYSWVVVGLAAVPSTVFWSRLAGKIGYIKPLSMALILQVIGVIMPVLVPNVVGVTVGSILFGGTFMGISMLALAAVRIMRPSSGNQAIALMTGFFGVGQILGPVGAGIVLDVTHSYELSLILATLVLVLALSLLIIGAAVSNRKSFIRTFQ